MTNTMTNTEPLDAFRWTNTEPLKTFRDSIAGRPHAADIEEAADALVTSLLKAYSPTLEGSLALARFIIDTRATGFIRL
ncbi:hypothetical protein [Paraburkholderia tropica]|uniref:hypothetical protein n=1 Tax=Paraburkholderia tropica TaxID=92647 RepID=UPI002AB7CFF8|nr:hypothetical protein [Paraburkholderia tropica]